MQVEEVLGLGFPFDESLVHNIGARQRIKATTGELDKWHSFFQLVTIRSHPRFWKPKVIPAEGNCVLDVSPETIDGLGCTVHVSREMPDRTFRHPRRPLEGHSVIIEQTIHLLF